MASLVARPKCGRELMHMRGGPATISVRALWRRRCGGPRFLERAARFADFRGRRCARELSSIPGSVSPRTPSITLKLLAGLLGALRARLSSISRRVAQAFRARIAGRRRKRCMEFGTAAVNALAIARPARRSYASMTGPAVAVVKMAVGDGGTISEPEAAECTMHNYIP